VAEFAECCVLDFGGGGDFFESSQEAVHASACFAREYPLGVSLELLEDLGESRRQGDDAFLIVFGREALLACHADGCVVQVLAVNVGPSKEIQFLFAQAGEEQRGKDVLIVFVAFGKQPVESLLAVRGRKALGFGLGVLQGLEACAWVL